MRLGILRSPINDRGGEARGLIEVGDDVQLLGEYYQPFGWMNRYFYGARLHYFDRKLDQYDADGNRFAEYGASQFGLQLIAGREFGNIGALGLGLRRFTGEAERLIGDPLLLPDIDFEIGEAFIELTLDRLDSAFFPRHGYVIRNRYLYSSETLGADVDFEQLELDYLGAFSRGSHSFQGGLRYYVTIDGNAPIQSLFRIGGFSRLVGYQSNQLVDQNYALLFGGYSYHFGNLLGRPALLGGTLEYGNVWEDRSDISFSDGVLNASAYIGLDSWIGPVLLGIGGREGGERNVFLEVGRRF
jgi:NTE family protein